MQIIVQLDALLVLDFDKQPTGLLVKEQVSWRENVPIQELGLFVDGRLVEDEAIVPEDCLFIRAKVINAVCGGKGGFGGLLKSMAKQKGKTKTTDFGACRDLNGRRLRHINDEILLNKWKEAKDRGEEFDVEEDTATGIDLWYLSVPSWAEGVKVDKRKKFLKPRMKTHLCLDWVRARQEGAEPPPGAPQFWGCPRGPRCEFAHGEVELRGDALKNIQDSRVQAKRDEADKKQDAYIGVINRTEKDEEEVNELVLAGLRAAKKAKTDVTKAKVVPVVKEVVEEVIEELPSTELVNPLLSTKASDVLIDHDAFVVIGNSTFGTALASQCGVTENSWYYEAEILSDGLMQIGWTQNDFQREVLEGDGVGDDSESWAYDGFRQLCWHNGESAIYGPESGIAWKQGDVVGCYLAIESSGSASISFSLNGANFGEAFTHSVVSSSGSSSTSKLCYFPALSLDRNERVGINLGQATFRHYQPLKEGKGNKYRAYQPVWNAIPCDILISNGFSGEKIVMPAEHSTESTPPPTEKSTEPVDYFEIPLESSRYDSVAALENLGMEHLKHELIRRGLKSGGTLKERSERLFSVRGIPADQIDKKLLVKK